MSVIAIKINPDGVTVGSDSLRVHPDTGEKSQFEKLREVNGMVIGASGRSDES